MEKIVEEHAELVATFPWIREFHVCILFPSEFIKCGSMMLSADTLARIVLINRIYQDGLMTAYPVGRPLAESYQLGNSLVSIEISTFNLESDLLLGISGIYRSVCLTTF
jgi:hypothetical protein